VCVWCSLHYGARALPVVAGGLLQCVDVPAKRVWEEPFYDLSVDVRGHSRLEGSLDSFMEPEMLKGDNQWKTEEYGRQDARKGMRMVSLPPVLQFHFKRFAYDASTGGMRKINDRFEFPTVLDMRKWVTGNQLDTSSTTYALRAIVMHQGGPDRGHYYAYVRPSGETNNWFEVNDTVVKPVTEAHVLSNAFGGHGRGLLGRMAQLFSPGHSDSSSSAYMVQYSCTTSVPGSKTLQESQEEVLVDGPLREQ
jgi:ubiquitin carboxyl-terminal hydrolase 7